MHRYQFILLCGAALLVGCAENKYQAPPPKTVTVANPVRDTVVRSLKFTGTTVPIERVEIRARVQGYLEAVLFEPGTEVEVGAPLFRIDPKPFQARVNQAIASQQLAQSRIENGNAQVAMAEAQSRNASLQLERSMAAAASGAVTQSQLDELRAALDTANAQIKAGQATIAQAQAEVAAATAALEEAQLDLDYTNVTSPIRGRVGRNLVDVGSLVGASEATHLTTVMQYDPIYAEYTVSESDVLMWKELQRMGVVESDPTGAAVLDRPLLLELANETDYPHEGHLNFVDLAIDESTGTHLVRGLFRNPNRDIPPGAFVRIKVPITEAEALLIDDRAVSRDQAGMYVLVVNDKNVVERRNITPGEVYDGRREVREGLKETDRVVVNGLLFARPGAIVNPVNDSSTDSGTPEQVTPEVAP